MKNIMLLICISVLMLPTLGNSSISPLEANYQEGVKLRKSKSYAKAHEQFSFAACSNDHNLSLKAMHNLGTVSFHQKLYNEANIWFQNSNEHSLEHFGEPFQPSVKNLKTIVEDCLLDSPENLGPGGINWNWTRRFQLLNGNTIEHRRNRIIVVEGYADIPGSSEPSFFTYTKDLIGMPTSTLVGNVIGNILALSHNDTEASFEEALFKSGIYNGEYSLENALKKFAYKLSPQF